MPGKLLAFETIGDDGKPVRGAVDVRVVDLEGIAGEDDFGALSATGDDGLHLVRREVLRLVDDEVLVRKAAPADVGERLDLDLARFEQLGESARFAPLAAAGGE